MREPVYRKIVFWISNQRTWIDVVDADMYGVFAFLYRGYTCHFTSRFLLLRAYKSNNGIADGTTWIVSEYALDRALAEYRKINRAFRDKIKKSPDSCRKPSRVLPSRNFCNPSICESNSSISFLFIIDIF